MLRLATEGATVETFDLEGDPAETKPVAAPAGSATLVHEEAERWRSASRPFTPKDNYMAEAMRPDFVRHRRRPDAADDREWLKSLGTWIK